MSRTPHPQFIEQDAVQDAPMTLDTTVQLWTQRTLMMRCQGAAWTVVAFTLLTAPLDLLSMPTAHHLQLSLGARAFTVALALISLAVARTMSATSTWTWPAAWSIATLLGIVGAVTTARLGGLDQPWIYVGYLMPVWTAPLPLPPLRRGLAVLGSTLAWWVPVLVLHPEAWTSSPMNTIVGVSAFSALLFGWLGDTLWRTELNTVSARHALERSEADLVEANTHLEARVSARTEQLHSTLRRLEHVRHEERHAMATLLHDELGQELTALRLYLGSVHRQDPDISASVDDKLDRLHHNLIRILLQLRPRVFETQGFRAAVESLNERLLVPSGIEATVTIDGTMQNLPDALVLDTFRTVQEAITNVVRHAQATRVRIEVNHRAHEVSITVTDNGEGLTGASHSLGLGIVGIQDRTRARGGTFSLATAPEGGTRLHTTVPTTPRPSP